MKRFFMKRRKDTFRTGKENGFRILFRNWLSADGFGICRIRRTENQPGNDASSQKQAMVTAEGLQSPPSVTIAVDKPGDIGLYLALKRRSAKSLSEPTGEPGAGRQRSENGSGKAVQE
jgi:hypothetical protein